MIKNHIVFALGIFFAITALTPLITPAMIEDGRGEYIPRASYTSRGPIIIEANSQFTSANGVVGGTGSAGDPYIISGWEIDASGGSYGIYIANTTVHFIIKNVKIYNATSSEAPNGEGGGIVLNNITNGTVYGASIHDCVNGVVLTSASDMSITHTTCENNNGHGIYGDGVSGVEMNNIDCHNNTLKGLYIKNPANILLNDSRFENNSADGVYFESGHDIASDNIHLYDNDGDNIVYNDISGGSITNITTYHAKWDGVFSKYSDHIDIGYITSIYNGDDGIEVRYCDYMNIFHVNAGDNGDWDYDACVRIYDSDNTVASNITAWNTERGVYVAKSKNVVLKDIEMTRCSLALYDTTRDTYETLTMERVRANSYDVVFLRNADYGGSQVPVSGPVGELILYNVSNASVPDIVVDCATTAYIAAFCSHITYSDINNSNSVFGIYLPYSNNITIRNTALLDVLDTGIFTDRCEDLSIIGTTITGARDDARNIYMNYVARAELVNITAGDAHYGIKMAESNNITMDGVYIYNQSSGIYIYKNYASGHMGDISMKNLHIVDCSYSPVYMHGLYGNRIRRVNISGVVVESSLDSGHGLMMWYIDNLLIKNLTYTARTGTALYFYKSSIVNIDNIQIRGSKGMEIMEGDNITLENSVLSGIRSNGITVYKSPDFIMTNTTVSYCSEYGLKIESSPGSEIKYCNFVGNYYYGLFYDESYVKGTVRIHHNNFINNSISPQYQMEGFDAEGNNIWYYNGEGNYWGSYRAYYPTATNDGHVWDIPYYLGESRDMYPLVHPVGHSDSSPPEFRDESPAEVSTLSAFDFMAIISDDTWVEYAGVEYWYGDESNSTRAGMQYDYDDNAWTVSIWIPPAPSGRLNYRFYAMDASGTLAWSEVYSRNITDTARPIISDTSLEFPTTGEQYILTVYVYDLSPVEVNLTYWFNSHDPVSVQMQSSGDEWYHAIDIPLNQTGDLHYIISATDAYGNSNTTSERVRAVVDNDPPVAMASADRTEIYAGESVNFTSQGSEDNTGIVRYIWTFNYGDTRVILFGPEVSFTFLRNGTYNITLTVTDAWGNLDTDSVVIQVLSGQDSDGDGVPDNIDSDDDNDGYSDEIEIEHGTNPQNSSSTPPDNDGDFLPDDIDSDDDNDGYNDSFEEACGSDPSNPFSSPGDNDNDGIPDITDDDDDNDGWNDTIEVECGTDPRDNQSYPSDSDGDGIPDAIDGDDDNDGYSDDNDAFPLDSQEWADSDGDGTGDNSDSDDDNDGYSDDVEIQCGTDPLDAGSAPADSDGDGIPDIIDNDDDNDGYNDSVDAFPLDPREWADSDGDGTGDNMDSDDDNDGMPDDWEMIRGLDPRDSADAAVDSDGDGLSNIEEYRLHISPHEADSDGDGIPDGWEVEHGLDPSRNDSALDPDGDGLSNIEEYTGGTDPMKYNELPRSQSSGSEESSGYVWILVAEVLVFAALFAFVYMKKPSAPAAEKMQEGPVEDEDTGGIEGIEEEELPEEAELPEEEELEDEMEDAGEDEFESEEEEITDEEDELEDNEEIEDILDDVPEDEDIEMDEDDMESD